MVVNVKKEWWKELDLDYSGENNFASFFPSEGNIHSYPAKAVPDMVKSLLIKLKETYNITTVLDPFVGSGTVALESKCLGLNFYGSDLNPLSILLAKTKSLTVKNTIVREIIKFSTDIDGRYSTSALIPLVSFSNIDYWFKKDNIKELSFIKWEIRNYLRNCSLKNTEAFGLILLTAFSSTIRSSSLTRNGEFKLYRMSPVDMKKFNVNAISIFQEKLTNLLNMLVKANEIKNRKPIIELELKDAKNLTHLKKKKINLVLTSPPYGDSQSTVAYGQFSRLSIQWSRDLLKDYLGITSKADNVDEFLLGGKKSTSSISARVIMRQSITLRKLFLDMKKICRKDLIKLKKMRKVLTETQKELSKGKFKWKKFSRNVELLKLMKERIRLDFFRDLNQVAVNTTNKEIKKQAKLKVNSFIECMSENSISNENLKFLETKIPFVLETINRKIIAIPKRVKSVLHFFKELYAVVVQTDNVLLTDGIQAWIVGHRTVLGALTVNMAEVLNEWFVSLGYSKITTLHRQYSFKRMPHHINSTVSRDNKIKTMMHEHIIVVRKNKKIKDKKKSRAL